MAKTAENGSPNSVVAPSTQRARSHPFPENYVRAFREFVLLGKKLANALKDSVYFVDDRLLRTY